MSSWLYKDKVSSPFKQIILTLIFILPWYQFIFIWSFLTTQIIMLLMSFITLRFVSKDNLTIYDFIVCLLFGSFTYFNMAAGFMPLMLSGLLILYRFIFYKERKSYYIVFVIVAFIVSGIMIYFIPHVPHHDVLKIHSIKDFINRLLHPNNVIWVIIATPPLFVILYELIKSKLIIEKRFFFPYLSYLFGVSIIIATLYSRPEISDRHRVLLISIIIVYFYLIFEFKYIIKFLLGICISLLVFVNAIYYLPKYHNELKNFALLMKKNRDIVQNSFYLERQKKGKSKDYLINVRKDTFFLPYPDIERFIERINIVIKQEGLKFD